MFGIFDLFGRSAVLKALDHALREAGLHPLLVRYRTSPSETQGARATPATRPDTGEGGRGDKDNGAAAINPATEHK